MRERARLATARGSKSFYFATRFFPRRMAEDAWAVYWFCRTTDDLVDEAAVAPDLDSWSASLRAALEGRRTGIDVLDHFAATARRCGIPAEYPLDLIEGVRMDLSIARYETFDGLRLYCYRVASTVGLMMMHVIGFDGAPHRQAIDLGIAMQLTNILRDVGEDLRRGRIYLPLEDLRRFGYSERDLAAATRNDAFSRLMDFQCRRARQFYASGLQGLPALHSRGRFSVELAARIYSRLLPRIESSGYEVFQRRAVVPRLEKYWITAQTLCSNAVSAALPWARSSSAS